MKVRHPMFAVAIASSVYSGAEKQNPPKEIGVILTTANIAIQFQPEEMDCMRVGMRVVLVSGGWNQGTGSHPTLPNRGKMKVKAVVPYAAFSDQMDRRIVTMMKQKHRPAEQIVRNDRPPKRFMSETGIAEPTRKDEAVVFCNGAFARCFRTRDNACKDNFYFGRHASIFPFAFVGLTGDLSQYANAARLAAAFWNRHSAKDSRRDLNHKADSIILSFHICRMTPMSFLVITAPTGPLLQVIDYFTLDIPFEQRDSEDLWKLRSIISGQKRERKTG
ncbi:hypothetical protein AUP68_08201 [Ilyonectria robusta]